METVSTNKNSRIAPDINTALLRWFRFSNEAIDEAIKISQPMLDVYFKSLGTIMPELKNYDLKSVNDLYRGKNCDIPETGCPPYCVCDMEWDACEGETVTGTIDIINTGQQTASFTITSGTFCANNDNSGITPQFTPASFALAPGETRAVGVIIKAEGSFDPSTTYTSQVKVRGRYEQCVRLKLRVKRKSTPCCSVEHGEIPKHIVAHNWYDHFQCEELCFQPVHRTIDQTGDGVTGVTIGKEISKNSVSAAKTTTLKKAATKKSTTKKATVTKRKPRTKK